MQIMSSSGLVQRAYTNYPPLPAFENAKNISVQFNGVSQDVFFLNCFIIIIRFIPFDSIDLRIKRWIQFIMSKQAIEM